MLKDADLDNQVEIDSAGTHDYHPGKKPDSRMTQALGRRGIDNYGSGRQFTADDFSKFDLILAMDSENLREIQQLDPSGEHRHKVKRMTDFCSLHEFQIPDVPDPYYGGEEGFEHVADLLTDGCQGLIKHIQELTQ